MPLITRRTALQLSAAVGVGALFSVATTTKPTATQPLTIGYVPIACAMPLILADALGLFASHGAAVKLKKFAGWADLWSAYATGQLHVAHMLAPMPVAIDSGMTDAQRPTELAFTQNTNGQAITLAARHHGAVTTARDFRGMVLGIPFEYSVHALLLRQFLETGGVRPGEDVELRLLRPADMVAQLEVGTIDGFVGPEPFNQRAIASGAGRIFRLTRQLWDGHPCCSIAMAKDWKERHPETARALVAALSEAALLADDDSFTPQLISIASSPTYLNQPATLFEPVFSGRYRDWDSDKEVLDPLRVEYGGPTDPGALIWMTTQLTRWGLAGNAVPHTDEAIIAASRAVLTDGTLPAELPDLTISGYSFSPLAPTQGR
ncbi:ABC transporter substrate-binding protein [Corynebacterium hindlerae]|uniref:ABC transporter substrate-binding protein n=1 Tax=Corynebacterium hindlerae TaxID=699041 RepID=UPI001AD6F2F1|nr:ABC transporter substrate-binding protein [Corynebacterium hindlerae]QTH60324.1 ABC transporter substrate-binding protein [Corynebacterium hindlerae]